MLEPLPMFPHAFEPGLPPLPPYGVPPMRPPLCPVFGPPLGHPLGPPLGPLPQMGPPPLGFLPPMEPPEQFFGNPPFDPYAAPLPGGGLPPMDLRMSPMSQLPLGGIFLPPLPFAPHTLPPPPQSLPLPPLPPPQLFSPSSQLQQPPQLIAPPPPLPLPGRRARRPPPNVNGGPKLHSLPVKRQREESLSRQSDAPLLLAPEATATSAFDTSGSLCDANALALPHIMDALSKNFLPDAELKTYRSAEHMFINIEEAWWYYKDVYREAFAHLPALDLKEFAECMFDFSPRLDLLRDSLLRVTTFNELVSSFRRFKGTIPCAGAILVSTGLNYVVLVKGFGFTGWGFPKGKLKDGETCSTGAVREVKEEIGYDIGVHIEKDQRIEMSVGRRKVTLFICKDVPMGSTFEPETRNEISEIAWHRVSSVLSPQGSNRYISIVPFMKQFIVWLHRERIKQQAHVALANQKDAAAVEEANRMKKLRQTLLGQLDTQLSSLEAQRKS
eukprot:TRINITY_DN870_c1_g1_i4.p1 TRINITY_DN870_c1_g1~~TRINITY_DN870_c1_g1_i4.p1  ORF type:complete len:499 (+),score=99.05 TRINITY_DN870_c1_g1_i4:153-1649(+)